MVLHPSRRAAGDASPGSTRWLPGIASPKPQRVSRRGCRRQCPRPRRYVRCPHSMLHTWLAGAALPRLENLLRIARYLNVPISSFYAPFGPTPTNIAAAKQAVAIRGKRSVSPSRHASEIRRVLLAALDEDVPLRVTEIAASWATQPRTAFMRLTGNSVTRSQRDIDGQAGDVGGTGLERLTSARLTRNKVVSKVCVGS